MPVEIITTASSEADQEAEWTKASNEDIKVSGYLRNRIARENRKAEENDSGDEGTATIQYRTGFIRENMDSATPGNMRKMYLTEHYDLPAGEKAVNLLHSFFGLPDAFISEHSFAVNIVADDDIRVATASDLDEEEDSEEDDLSEIPLVNDLITETATCLLYTSSQAGCARPVFTIPM